MTAEDEEGYTLCAITFLIGDAMIIIEYEGFLVPFSDLMFHHFI